MKRLNIEELWNIRKQVSIGSLFLSDYDNSFGFRREELSNFFDGWLEECEYYMSEDIPNYNGSDFWNSFIKDYDNSDSLFDYYNSLEEECIDSLFVKEV